MPGNRTRGFGFMNLRDWRNKMSKFGWSMPAGYNNNPMDYEPYISELQEAILGILEDAGVPVIMMNRAVKWNVLTYGGGIRCMTQTVE